MTYFAFTYPFSYEECLNYFDKARSKVEKKLKDEVYFHRELLTYSLEDRVVELITITGKNKQLEEKEDSIEGLFPEPT